MITRRALLALSASTLLRGVEYRNYSSVLPDYLRRLAATAYQRRNEALAQLTTRDAIAKRQAWVRDTFWSLVGGKPVRTAANIRTLGNFEHAGYKVEKLTYESQPGLVIPANLYIPKDHKPPFPGVLFQMGHSLNGKAAEPYQKCCQGLAGLGYLVLAFDPMGQGERRFTKYPSADDEHTMNGKQMLLVGDTATRMNTWDAVVSLDVLASHPLVDKSRLASTGQSGGGTVTMFLAAVEERLAAAAVSCGNTENFACKDFNPPGSVDDAEQNFIGSGAVGFDKWDTLYALVPKPLLIAQSARDFFGTYSPSYVTSGRGESAKLARIYETLGVKDRLEWYETPLPHALSKDLRLRIYDFFGRNLQGRAVTEEPPVQPEPEETLLVGKTGNVIVDFSSKTPPQLVRERFRPPSLPTVPDIIARVLPQSARALTLGSAKAEGARVEAIEIESEPGVFLPAYVWLPEAPRRTLLLIEPQGRAGRWREGDLYHQLAAEGVAVCALDIRGVGDLRPEAGRGNPLYTTRHANEDSYAWASLVLARPLLAQRVTDIVAAGLAMRSYPPLQRTTLILAARGSLTVPATFAAMVSKSFDRVALEGGLSSFASLIEKDEFDHTFANFLPGMLNETDLPLIQQSLGTRLIKLDRWDLASLSALH